MAANFIILYPIKFMNNFKPKTQLSLFIIQISKWGHFYFFTLQINKDKRKSWL